MEEALAAERARLRPLLERAEDAVRDHDFPKGHRYDVLVGDLRAELAGWDSQKGHSATGEGA